MLLSYRDGGTVADVVIEPRGQLEELPLVPTLLCLLAANWVGGIAAEFVGGGPMAVAMAQVHGSFATLVVVQVASALVAAIAVRYLLQAVVGCEISLGAAVAALLAGAVVTLGGQIALASSFGGGHGLGVTSTAAVPLLFVLGPVATFVSYRVLQYTRPLQPSLRSRNPYLEPYLGPDVVAREQPGLTEETPYDVCVDAVRETSAGVVDAATRAPVDHVANIVLGGLTYLEAAINALDHEVPPANVPTGLHHKLIEAARAVRQEVLDAARAAAVGDDPRLRLADSEGMRRMRATLRELADLGVGIDW